MGGFPDLPFLAPMGSRNADRRSSMAGLPCFRPGSRRSAFEGFAALVKAEHLEVIPLSSSRNLMIADWKPPSRKFFGACCIG